MNVKVGTAGWTVPAGFADRFPGAGTHLARYARVLGAVEINTSFKKTHRPSTYRRWAKSVPANFRFSIKVPREITHVRRLVDVGEPLDVFLEGVSELGEKLGPLLIQLPPSLEYDAELAARFFASLRGRFGGAIVVEPRHASWFVASADWLLQQWELSRVAADPAPVAGVGAPGGWQGMVYHQLHGSPVMYRSAYDAAFLKNLADLLRECDEDTERWVIFDNTAEGQAIPNALDLMDYTKGL